MIRKPENIALFDMDGTIVDYEGRLMRDLMSLSSPEEPSFSIQDLHDDNCPDYLWRRISMIRKVPGWWKGLPRLDSGLILLEIAKDIGFEINILTKGPSSNATAWKEKVEWVREHLGDVKITITEDKGLTYGRILVDDYWAYMQRWLMWRPRGLGIMPVDLRYHKPMNVVDVPKNVIQFTGENSQIETVRKLMQKAYDR